MVCAQDMGIVVNPEGAKMQIEGGVTMGLGYTLSEELRFRGGDILDRNFGTYEIPRFSWVPSIEAVLVKNDDLGPAGRGRAAHHDDRRGDRQCHLRCDRRASIQVADDRR